MADRSYQGSLNLIQKDAPLRIEEYLVVSGSSAANYPVSVKKFGAKGDGSTDDTQAILNAVASGEPNLYFPNGIYPISDLITVTGSMSSIFGDGRGGTVFRATTASAGFKFGNGTDVIYPPLLRDFVYQGAGLSTIGMQFDNASEALMVRVGVIDCVTGFKLFGATIPTSLKMEHCVCSNHTTGFNLLNAADVQIYGPDFYDNDTVFDFTQCWRLLMMGGWIEDWNTVFLFDHTSHHAVAYTVNAIGTYYLCSSVTRGGAGHTSRIIKSVGDNNTYQSYCDVLNFENNHLLLTACKYVAEVDWGATYAYAPLGLKLADNHLMTGTANMTAWVTSDVLDNPGLTVRFDNNQFQDVTTIPITDVALPFLSVNGFADIGDSGSYAFQVGDLTTDGAYHDLDFSVLPWVPYGATRIFLTVTVQDDAAGSTITFRKNGNSNEVNNAPCITQVANVPISYGIEVSLDASRVAEYKATNTTWTTINIAVRGWI